MRYGNVLRSLSPEQTNKLQGIFMAVLAPSSW